jgi:AcrR family transcriptional regulator
LARWNNSLQTHEEIFQLKRNAIVRESGRIFSRCGYHNTSLDDVASSLNVAKGTLYNYVKDKQEILLECHKIALSIGERAFATSEENGGSGLTRLRNVLYHYVRTLTDEFGACAILTELAALRDDDRKQIIKRRDNHDKKFVELLEQGINDGSIRTVDTHLAVYTFMGAINYLPTWYAPNGRLTSEEIAKKMTDLLVSGLSVEPPAVEAV